MRTMVAAAILICLSGSSAWAQTATPDLSKGIYASAADVAAVVKKVGDVPNGNGRIIQLAPYNVAIEHRMPAKQGASVHEKEAELFYIIDGSATIVTGGKLIDEKRNGDNLTGTGIEGGTPQRLSKGDFIMVPPGVPHWFSNVDSPLTQMSLHLPMAK